MITRSRCDYYKTRYTRSTDINSKMAQHAFNVPKIIIVFFVCISISHVTLKSIVSKKGYPVILIPGDGGSQFEARLDKPSVVHYFCEQHSKDYFDLWLNMELLVPYILDCWIDNMRLIYDNVTHQTKNSPGVDIRIPGFGNTSTVEYLDPSKASAGLYFAKLVDALVTWGYERGVSVRGAPYDFRRAPNEQEEYFKQFKALVEETYNTNGAMKVVFIAHSMGNSLLLYFLNHQNQSWKDKYIHSFVSLAGVWGGAVKSMKAFISGDNLDVFVLNSITMRGGQRTYPSLAFLLPSIKFWQPNEVLVMTDRRNYTINDLYDLFQDIGFPDGYLMRKDVEKLVFDLSPPGVEIHCVYGIQVDTPEVLQYAKGKFPDSQPHVYFGDGDGTVNRRSQDACLHWKSQQKQPIYSKFYNGVGHLEILSHSPMFDYIQSVVFS